MPNLVTRSHTIEFVVAVNGHQPAQPEREALASSLKQSLYALLADLYIPARFTLSLQFSEATDQTGPAVSVSIHGQNAESPMSPRAAVTWMGRRWPLPS